METSEPYTLNDETFANIDSTNNLELLPDQLYPSVENSPVAEEVTIKEGNLVKQAIEKLPEAVLPHVINAAEHNEPLEDLYEKRHESKDIATAPVAIGNVIAEGTDVTSVMTPSGYSLPRDEEDIPSLVSAPSLTPKNVRLTYNQAIRVGFALAIGLIAIFLLGYFLIHH